MTLVSTSEISLTKAILTKIGLLGLIWLTFDPPKLSNFPYNHHSLFPSKAGSVPSYNSTHNETESHTIELNATVNSNSPTNPLQDPPFWDPRFDQFVIGVKSGYEVMSEHVPMQLLTSLRYVKNIYFFGDASIPLGHHIMDDVVTNLYEITEEAMKKTKEWDRAQLNRTDYHRAIHLDETRCTEMR